MGEESLNSTWVFWYHHDPNSWMTQSFTKLAEIYNLSEFWMLVDAIQQTPLLLLEHIYFMRGGIYPVWEDSHNRNGGCWSIKIDIKDSFQTLVKMMMYVIGENSLYKGEENISYEITGISLCQKNNYNSVLQLWTSNARNNKLKYIHKELTAEFGYEIIFRPHIPEH